MSLDPRPAPSGFIVDDNAAWRVVMPSVYRYEDQRWIDQFFEDGTLRISSFNRFGQYPDEWRGDQHEGVVVSRGITSDKEVWVLHRLGLNAAVFCCSRVLSGDLMSRFERNSAFEIFDTTGFALAVAEVLPSFIGGVEGGCIYRDSRTICREMPALELDVQKMSLSDMGFFSSVLGGEEALLLKEKKYEPQAEYRFAWGLAEQVAEFVDVVCPKARQYCRPISA